MRGSKRGGLNRERTVIFPFNNFPDMMKTMKLLLELFRSLVV